MIFHKWSPLLIQTLSSISNVTAIVSKLISKGIMVWYSLVFHNLIQMILKKPAIWTRKSKLVDSCKRSWAKMPKNLTKRSTPLQMSSCNLCHKTAAKRKAKKAEKKVPMPKRAKKLRLTRRTQKVLKMPTKKKKKRTMMKMKILQRKMKT